MKIYTFIYPLTKRGSPKITQTNLTKIMNLRYKSFLSFFLGGGGELVDEWFSGYWRYFLKELAVFQYILLAASPLVSRGFAPKGIITSFITWRAPTPPLFQIIEKNGGGIFCFWRMDRQMDRHTDRQMDGQTSF